MPNPAVPESSSSHAPSNIKYIFVTAHIRRYSSINFQYRTPKCKTKARIQYHIPFSNRVHRWCFTQLHPKTSLETSLISRLRPKKGKKSCNHTLTNIVRCALRIAWSFPFEPKDSADPGRGTASGLTSWHNSKVENCCKSRMIMKDASLYAN